MNPLDSLMATLIARIDAGVPPWRAPWANGGVDPSMPLRADGQPFSGTNAWILAFEGATRGYSSPYWLTFQQALKLGAPVAKGEQGAKAILYKTKVVDDGEAQDDSDDGGGGKTLRFLKAYTVFNAAQLLECPAEFLSAPPVDYAVRDTARNAILEAVPVRLQHGGDRAFFNVTSDYVQMPVPEAFNSPEEYLSILAHELIHSTGHSARLDRTFGQRFGDNAYAMEELVAEIGSALLGLRIGLPPEHLDRHASYLASWSTILRDRPGALIQASSLAQKAVDLVLSYSTEAAAPLAAAA